LNYKYVWVVLCTVSTGLAARNPYRCSTSYRATGVGSVDQARLSILGFGRAGLGPMRFFLLGGSVAVADGWSKNGGGRQ
jgi:hypothetical protein